MKISKKLASAMTVVAVLSLVGVAGAATGAIITRGAGPGAASLKCPGGMTRLGHEVNEDMSIFPGDPAVHVDVLYTVAEDFFRVEDLDIGSHAGTHLDVPRHFVDPARDLTDLAADEFVWPVYKIDVRGIEVEEGDFIEKDFIQDYEKDHGRIKKGSLVVLQTGAEEFFGLDGDGDMRVVDADGLADNVDDMFDFPNAGFSGPAVQWLFDKRDIAGVGSDAYGPDAWHDADEDTDLFDATYTTLINDGVALVAIANLDSVNVRGDIVMAPTIALSEGSGFSTDPIACHGARDNGRGSDWDD